MPAQQCSLSDEDGEQCEGSEPLADRLSLTLKGRWCLTLWK